MSATKKKEKDPGQVIFNKDGIPICSEHGDTLWVDENNVNENTAFCHTSDETIEAAKNTRLTRKHLSTLLVPPEIDDLVGGLHEENG